MNSATPGRMAAVDITQGTYPLWLAPDVAIALYLGKDDRKLLGWLIRNPPTIYVEQQRAAASWMSRPAADAPLADHEQWATAAMRAGESARAAEKDYQVLVDHLMDVVLSAAFQWGVAVGAAQHSSMQAMSAQGMRREVASRGSPPSHVCDGDRLSPAAVPSVEAQDVDDDDDDRVSPLY